MAQRMEMSLVLVLVTMFLAKAAAQSSCTNVIISMSPCLNYITGNSSTPSSGCCSQLASVVRSSPQCLCEVLNGGGSSLGVNVNQTQALALPGACNVQTPPLSQCNGKPADDYFLWFLARVNANLLLINCTLLKMRSCFSSWLSSRNTRISKWWSFRYKIVHIILSAMRMNKIVLYSFLFPLSKV